MSDIYKGAIDCDLHPRVPTPRAISQYMDDHWRDTVELRGIETWDSISYPPNAPLTLRPDWRKAGADTEPGKAAKETLDRFGFAHAICNSPVSGPGLPRREPGGGLRQRAQRLAGGGMARQGPTPEGLGSASDPVAGAGGGGDRAALERQAVRAGADAGDGRASTRQVHVLADLCCRRAPRLHGRHPCGLAATTTRSPARAGPPTTPRTTPPSRSASTPSSAASSARACSSNTPGSRWC